MNLAWLMVCRGATHIQSLLVSSWSTPAMPKDAKNNGTLNAADTHEPGFRRSARRNAAWMVTLAPGATREPGSVFDSHMTIFDLRVIMLVRRDAFRR